jgi:hypothetical protein
MAPRKDMMRIIRQDAGFSAKLGFGGQLAQATASVESPPQSVAAMVDAAAMEAPSAATKSATMPNGAEALEMPARPLSDVANREGENTSNEPGSPALAAGSAARGHVVYVAVSLTARQATLAESWASAARCSVQFLIRHVAQGMRDGIFDDWERNGMPDVAESRGARGRYPTSVTMTLRSEFAANLAARHDPHGILGLARVMGPAFRARFEAAFDTALVTAKHRSDTEGDQR